MYDAPNFAVQAIGHSLLALAFGAAIMVAATLVVERLITQAAMRRVLWQATLVGLCVLFAFELTGTSHALSSLLGPSSHPTASKIDIQAAPADRDKSQIPDAIEPNWKLAYTGYDSPAISTFNTPPLLFDNEDLAWLEPSSFPVERDTAAAERSVETEYRQPRAIANDSDEALAATIPPVPVQAHPDPTSQIANSAISILMLLWLGSTCLFGGRAILARARLCQLRRQWQPNDDTELERLVENLSHRIGMRQVVRIQMSDGLTTPVAFGLLRPTVLVPNDFTERFSTTQQQVILAHELAHLAGHDPAWLLASELVTALMWWHPLVHVARRGLLAASEQAADEACTLVPDGPNVLAECLVKLGRRLTGKPRLGWVAAEGSGLRSGLARRVQQLLKLIDRPAPHATRQVSGASRPIAVVLLILLTISCTLWVHPKASLAQGEETMNVLKGSWRQSLAAVALTAFLGPLTTDAAADEAPDGPPKPAQLEDGSPVDQLLLAQRGDRERGEREAREHRERDRDLEHREREGREHHERGEREREAEHREREARERAERDEHREHMAKEVEELHQRLREIEREKAELQRNAEAEAHELEAAIRETQEEREENARHIAELEREIAELRKEFAEEAEEEEEEEDEDEDEDEDDEEELEELEEEIDELVEELEEAREARQELAERAENLEREINELRVNARRRMAELEREFAEVRAHLARAEAAGRGNPERAEIMKRIGELTREIAGLRRAGKQEQAERLQAEIRELHARQAGPRDHDRREGMERLEAMERELHELREAGHHERTEHLEREMHELHRRLHAPRDEDRPGPPPELRARLDHLHVAMENLRAAGLHDQAEQIAQQIERIAREHHPGPPERHDPDARPRGPRDEHRPEPGGEVVEHLNHQIEQLRRENEELRHMMQELREAMNELRERR